MKHPIRSRTFWVNVIALVAIFLQPEATKDVLSTEVQGSILVVINLLLRLITKEKIVWK